MKYSQKLLDPRWQKKRLEIFNRDNFACTECGETKRTLHVHHEKYNGEPWEIENEKLKTLCDKCHNKEHFGDIEILSPTQNTLARFISPYDLNFQNIDNKIISTFNRIGTLKHIIPPYELKSLRSELIDLCIEHKIIIVDMGITYGLQ